jgi:hypothetical protein
MTEFIWPATASTLQGFTSAARGFEAHNYAPKAWADPFRREPQTPQSQDRQPCMLSRNTLSAHETTSHFLVSNPSILRRTFS